MSTQGGYGVIRLEINIVMKFGPATIFREIVKPNVDAMYFMQQQQKKGKWGGE